MPLVEALRRQKSKEKWNLDYSIVILFWKLAHHEFHHPASGFLDKGKETILELGIGKRLVNIHIPLLRVLLGRSLLPLDELQFEQFLHGTLHGGSILSECFPYPLATIPARIFDEVQKDVGLELVEAEKALEEVVD